MKKTTIALYQRHHSRRCFVQFPNPIVDAFTIQVDYNEIHCYFCNLHFFYWIISNDKLYNFSADVIDWIKCSDRAGRRFVKCPDGALALEPNHNKQSPRWVPAMRRRSLTVAIAPPRPPAAMPPSHRPSAANAPPSIVRREPEPCVDAPSLGGQVLDRGLH